LDSRETSFRTFGAGLRACLNPKKKGKNDGRSPEVTAEIRQFLERKPHGK
jgi:hypothetical protein